MNSNLFFKYLAEQKQVIDQNPQVLKVLGSVSKEQHQDNSKLRLY
jgi:hypothetical protein